MYTVHICQKKFYNPEIKEISNVMDEVGYLC